MKMVATSATHPAHHRMRSRHYWRSHTTQTSVVSSLPQWETTYYFHLFICSQIRKSTYCSTCVYHIFTIHLYGKCFFDFLDVPPMPFWPQVVFQPATISEVCSIKDDWWESISRAPAKSWSRRPNIVETDEKNVNNSSGWFDVEADIEHDLEGNIFRSTPIVKLVSKIFTHVVPCAFQYVSNKSPEYLES